MLPEQLKALRDAAGLTNQKWAELSGVSIPTITRILSDPNANPSYYNVEQLVRAAGGSMDILAGIAPEQAMHTVGYSPDLGAMYRAVIREDRREKRCVALALTFVVLILVSLFIYDFMHPDRGWIQEVTAFVAANA